MLETGRIMGHSESRISQILAAAHRFLRERLQLKQ